jgi:hypothetical protein
VWQRQCRVDAIDERIPAAARDRVALDDRARPPLLADVPAGALRIV